jgi:integrase
MSVKLIKKTRRKTYQIQVYLKKQKKMKWINTYCSNKKDAQAILKQYQLADIEYNLGLRESQLPNNDTPTLTESVFEYLGFISKSANYSKHTYVIKSNALSTFVDLVGGKVKLNELNKDDKNKYLKFLSSVDLNYSDATKNIKMRQVTAFLNWCIKEMDWIDKMPFRLEQIATNNEVKLITPNEFENILANESNEVLKSYYKLAYYCGLRRCEINHTELTKDRNGDDVLLITKTKGKPKKKRDVPIKSGLIKDWQICKTAMYYNDRLTKGFKRACVKAGIYEPHQTTFHALRHSFATIQASRGVSINELAKMMGHTETRTTERYADADRDMYVKLRKEENDPIYA